MRGRRLRSRGSHAIVLPDHALPAGTAILEPMPQNRLAEDARRPDRCASRPCRHAGSPATRPTSRARMLQRDQGQAADGPLVPDRMRPIRGRSGARSAGRRPEPGNVGLRRSGCCPFRACRSVGLGQNRPGARVESAGSKVGPVDVPTVMPGLPHSAEPQWHIRHGVFSRLLTFTARRPAPGSGVIAAARTTAARWPRSGSGRRSGRRPG